MSRSKVIAKEVCKLLDQRFLGKKNFTDEDVDEMIIYVMEYVL